MIGMYGLPLDYLDTFTQTINDTTREQVIDAFKRFQISDELCDEFGYEPLTKEDKAKIFGLNAAGIYDVDVDEQRQALPADAVSSVQERYLSLGGQRDNAVYGWVRAD